MLRGWHTIRHAQGLPLLCKLVSSSSSSAKSDIGAKKQQVTGRWQWAGEGRTSVLPVHIAGRRLQRQRSPRAQRGTALGWCHLAPRTSQRRWTLPGRPPVRASAARGHVPRTHSARGRRSGTSRCHRSGGSEVATSAHWRDTRAPPDPSSSPGPCKDKSSTITHRADLRRLSATPQRGCAAWQQGQCKAPLQLRIGHAGCSRSEMR